MKHRRHRRVDAKGVEAHLGAQDYAIENISVGGLFLRTPSPMPIGMPVRVELGRPGFKSLVQLSGRVVSVVTEAEAERVDTVAGVGIEFDPMAIEIEKRLHGLLRELGLTDLAEPTEIEPNSLYAVASPDTHKVESNVRGLLEMLTDALQKVKERDHEIAKLRDEIRRLQNKLEAKR